MLRDLARPTLRPTGCEVLLARDGESALELMAADDGPIDLLLTDVVLSGMSGMELGAQASALRPFLRLLVTSGYAGEEMDRRGIELCQAAILAKPYQPGELLDAVARALS